MVDIVALEGQTKVVASDGTVWAIQNGTPEKKYKGRSVPSVEEFPTFTETEVEKIDGVGIQTEDGRTKQAHSTSINKKIDEVEELPSLKKSDVEDNCLEVIEHSHHFSPYKSQLARELSDELPNRILKFTSAAQLPNPIRRSPPFTADTANTVVHRRHRRHLRTSPPPLSSPFVHLTSTLESVNELAQIMKDLSVLVIDQGTIIDRIDYNIQNVVVTVDKGLQQPQKAERNQKQGGMVMCASVPVILYLWCLSLTRLFNIANTRDA
ncbi:hypothetical protein SSX86_011490 [Deinandra increscens subsp. villosa]|uniref:t-SNARE coiled-coil homology domain-containing protein n=1 Tax=Deinandra increscens subsp. villosa TaxID=3103831 RepID=A0AAP0H222_9ASTR